MKEMKNMLIGGYIFIGLGFAVYWSKFGDFAYKGFAYNFGRAIVWPAILFPSLGKAIGGMILLGVIIAILVFKNDERY